MNTVTLSLEDYTELKERYDEFNKITSESYSIEVRQTLYAGISYKILNKDKTIEELNFQIQSLRKKLKACEYMIGSKPKKHKSLWQRLFK